MRFLLDTNALLWFLVNHFRLTSNNRALIQDRNNTVFVSVASLWEIAIKFSTGKMVSPLSFSEIVDHVVSNNSFRVLEIRMEHLRHVADLPHIHRDPFDRLLIAQSIAAYLPIITSDATIDHYAIQRIW